MVSGGGFGTLLREMKLLNGSELAEYIKVRQAHQVRALRQAHRIYPKLAIIQSDDSPVIDKYVSLKKAYGDDILVEVVQHKIRQEKIFDTIASLNEDDSVHGIIIQLPLAESSDTQRAVDAVLNRKDVDGLGDESLFEPATPLAINWLLAGYNISLSGKKIAIVGQGRLVGGPLSKAWEASGYDVTVFDEHSTDMHEQLSTFDLIVTATGVPGLIVSEDVKNGAVVVDAGTASENGKIVGDVAADLRLRQDVTITPEKGGVGPLTIAALFENVIKAASSTK